MAVGREWLLRGRKGFCVGATGFGSARWRQTNETSSVGRSIIISRREVNDDDDDDRLLEPPISHSKVRLARLPLERLALSIVALLRGQRAAALGTARGPKSALYGACL